MQSNSCSDYAAKVFGYATFGTVYGAIICLSGLFTFTQSALQACLHHTFQDDPEPLNLALATATLVIGVALVMYVDIQGNAWQRERAMKQNGERRPLLQPSPQPQPPPLQSQPPSSSLFKHGTGMWNNTDPNGGAASYANGVAGGGDANNDRDPERHSLMARPSRQALALSTVEETGEPETRDE